MSKYMEEEKKMTDGISAKVWQQIADKHLKPLPRWRFIFKEVILWCLFLIFLVVASISVSFIILEIFNADWDLHSRLAGSLVDYIIVIFPYFWLLCLSVVIVLAYYNFSLTRRGYKYGLLWIALGTVFLSILLGTVMYVSNLGQYLDEVAENYLPKQKIPLSKQHQLWNHPETGLLGGRVVFVALPRFFELKAFDEKHWLIVISDYRAPQFFIKDGEFVKIIGRKLNDNTFQSYEIRPWRSHDCPCCLGGEGGSNDSCKQEQLLPLPVK